MCWNRERSLERITRIRNSIPEISVTALERKMNLDNVTLARPKRIVGTHIYVAVVNEPTLGVDLLDPDEAEEAKKLIRAVHLWQREVSRIVCPDFDLAKIHFQGLRLHALSYRPINDEVEIVVRAVLLATAIERATRKGFNTVMTDVSDFVCAAGASHGSTVATRSGSSGDSELLFVGSAANMGAKAVVPGTRLRVTANVADLILDALEMETEEDVSGLIEVKIDPAVLATALADRGIDWSVETTSKRVEHDLESTPLTKIGASGSKSEIDKDALSLSTTKLVDAVSAFGDIDGFTDYVEGLGEDDAAAAEAIRAFHVMRAELRHVAVQDYDPTLRVQYQGDRIQILRHLPADEAETRALRTIEIAAGWESSMGDTLPELMPEISGLRLATGIAASPTVVSRLGEYGNRDMICLGRGTRRADRIQRKLEGGEVGTSKAVRDLLPKDVAVLFEWDGNKNAYVASDLSANTLAYAIEAASFDRGEPKTVTRIGEGLMVGIGTGHGNGQKQEQAPRRRFAH